MIGISPNKNKQVPLVIIYPKTGREIEERSFLNWANSQLQPVELKQVLVITPSDVPSGLTGKVLKRVLREKYADQFTKAPGMYSSLTS